MASASEARKAKIEETSRLLKQGLSRKQIAAQLGVHYSTAGDYLAALRGTDTKGIRARRREGMRPPA